MADSDIIEDFRNDENMNDDDVVARIMAVVNRYYQEATITDVSGSCPYGHCKGDRFRVTSMNSDGLCGGMYQAVHSQIVTCHHGGEIQWEKEPGSHSGICPEGVVHLDVKRKEKECRPF